jgi:hypothetical protein
MPGANDTPTPQDLHWAHTAAYLFVEEGGGDLTDRTVHHAAHAALDTCEARTADMRRAARLYSATSTALLEHLATVRNAFAWASMPGILLQARRCNCGIFQGPATPRSNPPSPESTDQEMVEAIREVATWAAGRGPAEAEKWVDDTVARPGDVPDQMICLTVRMLAETVDQGNTWTPEQHAETVDSDTDLAAWAINALMAAARDRDRVSSQATAADTLTALRRGGPVRYRRCCRILLLRTLSLLGVYLLDRAHTVARQFLHNGGGYLANPTVRQAAQAALNTFDKFVFANMRTTGQMDEDTYLAFLTHVIINADKDFELASRYTAVPHT